MISQKTFNRIIREIIKNDYWISDEHSRFFRGIRVYRYLVRSHKEVIREFELDVNFRNLIPDEYRFIRLNRFIESVKEHEKEIFYDCLL